MRMRKSLGLGISRPKNRASFHLRCFRLKSWRSALTSEPVATLIPLCRKESHRHLALRRFVSWIRGGTGLVRRASARLAALISNSNTKDIESGKARKRSRAGLASRRLQDAWAAIFCVAGRAIWVSRGIRSVWPPASSVQQRGPVSDVGMAEEQSGVAKWAPTAVHPLPRSPTAGERVRFGGDGGDGWMTRMVKVFGRRPSQAARLGTGPAYGNRPCTNPRGCG